MEQIRATVVQRQRLVDRIAHHPTERQVVLLIGLPGSGKTTLLTQLVQISSRPAITLRCSAHTPLTWDVIAAHLADQGIVAPTPADLPGIPLLIALDDLHHGLDTQGMPTAQTAAWLVPLLAHPTVQLICATQVMPLLPALARLAMDGQLVQISAADLAFTADETAALWAQHHGTAATSEQCATIVDHTAGWAAPVALYCHMDGPIEPIWLHLLVDDLLTTVAPVLLDLLMPLVPLPTLDATTLTDLLHLDDAARQIHDWLREGWLIQRDDDIHLQPTVREFLLQRMRTNQSSYHAITDAAARTRIAHDRMAEAFQMLYDLQAWEILVPLLLEHAEGLMKAHQHSNIIMWLSSVPAGTLPPQAATVLARCQDVTGDQAGALLTIDRTLALQPDSATTLALKLVQAGIELNRSDYAAADRLVQPYLEDATIPAIDRARLLRIHGITLAEYGAETAALDVLEQASVCARSQGESRLLALTLGDYGNIAARMGRYTLAERVLQHAQRVWQALGTPPDIAVAQSLHAQVLLHTNRLADATDLANRAFTHARAGRGHVRAATALATLGDIAFVEQAWDVALARYEQAIEEAQRANCNAMRVRALAMFAQTARRLQRADLLHVVLNSATEAPHGAPLDAAWVSIAQSVARIALQIDGSSILLEQAWQRLGDEPTLAHGMLMLTLAEAYWYAGQAAAAAAAWYRLDDLLLAGRAGVPRLLCLIALNNPDLLAIAQTQWNSPFAQRLTHSADRVSDCPRLMLRVLGTTDVYWQGELVKLPRHGAELLTMLVLAGAGGVSASDLRERLWGDADTNVAGFRKLLERVRRLLPDAIVCDEQQYHLNLAPAEIDADILSVLHTPIRSSEKSVLRAAADFATHPLLPGNDAPWVFGERQCLARRGADLWLALGHSELDHDHLDAAARAYRQASALAPLDERIVIAAMSLGLRRLQYVAVIEMYHTYRRKLDTELGLDPPAEIEALYQCALNAAD